MLTPDQSLVIKDMLIWMERARRNGPRSFMVPTDDRTKEALEATLDPQPLPQRDQPKVRIEKVTFSVTERESKIGGILPCVYASGKHGKRYIGYLHISPDPQKTSFVSQGIEKGKRSGIIAELYDKTFNRERPLQDFTLWAIWINREGIED